VAVPLCLPNANLALRTQRLLAAAPPYPMGACPHHVHRNSETFHQIHRCIVQHLKSASLFKMRVVKRPCGP
jgi:hypothetical protein